MLTAGNPGWKTQLEFFARREIPSAAVVQALLLTGSFPPHVPEGNGPGRTGGCPGGILVLLRTALAVTVAGASWQAPLCW